MTTFRLGNYHVTRIEEELCASSVPGYLFPDFDPCVLEEHGILTQPWFMQEGTGQMISSMHSWLIRDGAHTILIDTGGGNDKERARPVFARFHRRRLPYLERLREAGVAPEDVDVVINTHLHVDHVGWNTRLADGEWVPAFPKARYMFSRAEYAHWQSPGGGALCLPENIQVIADSVLPVVQAGQAELIDDGAEILPGLTFLDARGHTAAHGMVELDSGGKAALFVGDCLHHPIQVYRPEWNSRFCEMADAARATRRSLLEKCADRQALLMPAHFGAPHCGYVQRSAAGFAFRPAAPDT